MTLAAVRFHDGETLGGSARGFVGSPDRRNVFLGIHIRIRSSYPVGARQQAHYILHLTPPSLCLSVFFFSFSSVARPSSVSEGRHVFHQDPVPSPRRVCKMKHLDSRARYRRGIGIVHLCRSDGGESSARSIFATLVGRFSFSYSYRLCHSRRICLKIPCGPLSTP